MKPTLAQSLIDNVKRSNPKGNPHLWPSVMPTEAAAGIQFEAGKAVVKERDLHEDIIDFCADHGWQYLHGSMATRTHRTEGEPDFIILASNGRVFFIECKSRTGKLSTKQRDFAHHAEKNGHHVWTIRSMSEFRELTTIERLTP